MGGILEFKKATAEFVGNGTSISRRHQKKRGPSCFQQLRRPPTNKAQGPPNDCFTVPRIDHLHLRIALCCLVDLLELVVDRPKFLSISTLLFHINNIIVQDGGCLYGNGYRGGQGE